MRYRWSESVSPFRLPPTRAERHRLLRSTSDRSRRRGSIPGQAGQGSLYRTTATGRAGPVLAGPFDIVLLDEPSSGLDQSETERLGEILTESVTDRGIGLLLVEHDMSLVRQVCADIYVLDFGTLIFEGSPEQMLQSEVVKAAYLGSEADGGELLLKKAEEFS